MIKVYCQSCPFWETFLFFDSEKLSVLENPNRVQSYENNPKRTTI